MGMRGTGKLTEAAFTRQVLDLATLTGWITAHFRTSRVQRKNGSIYYETAVQGDGKGFPDIVLCRGRTLLVVELKIPPNKPTAEQENWLAAFRLVGAVVRVWVPGDWLEIEETLTDG